MANLESVVISFLSNHCDKEECAGIDFSVVPKGREGDLALQFFRLSKLKGDSPKVLVDRFEKILKSADFLEKVLVDGLYLNLFFKHDIFFRSVFETPEVLDYLSNKKVVLEYSSPNTNKPLHLGHMRNHALGISMANLYEAVGANVKRACVINDRGIHICKSMLAYQKFGNGELPQDTKEKGDFFVGRYYVLFDQKSKEDPGLLSEAQKMLQDWEAGDKSTIGLWEQMNGWTYEGHNETYKRQKVQFDKKYYESKTYEHGKKLAFEGVDKNIFYKKDGAVWVDLTSEGLDEKIIIRSDGTSVYLTQDLATTKERYKDFEFDEHIWVVGEEQNYHFKVLIACLDKLGLVPQEKMFHLSYGMVHLPEGRMKSREGTVIDADTLMDDLKSLVNQKMKASENSMSDDEREDIAEKIQDAAWKFYLLRVSPRKNITFDTKESIDFHGATGPYLQYAGVRIKSILQKISLSENFSSELSSFLGDAEKPLGRKIIEWNEVLRKAVLQKNPTYLATYLLELSQAWSSFYSEHSILKTSDLNTQKARVAMAKKTLAILEKGLGILGIEIPERM